MKFQKIIFFSFALILLACQSSVKTKKYKLTVLDAYDFRRNYFGHEKLQGKALDSFMNRNPEQCYKCEEGFRGKFYDELVQNKIITDQTLNISKLDILLENPIYNFSKEVQFDVKIDYLEYSKGLETPGYILTFTHNKKEILKDTLTFGFPPDVSFSILDANKDGKDELYTLFRGYIINGDNFYLDIYTVE